MTIQLSQLGIPDDEVRQFQSFIRIYSKGRVIFQEGDDSDPRIFLLRVGAVEVSKQVGDRQEILSRIEAVNFFGEIAVVANRPRTATITAASETVVVYGFDNPNLPAMLANPKWGTLLVRRLAESLDHMNIQYQQAQLQIDRLTQKHEQVQVQHHQLNTKYEQLRLMNERLRAIIGDVLGLFQRLHQAAGRDEALQRQFIDAVPRLVAMGAKDLKVEPTFPESHTLTDVYQRGILPETLYQATLGRPPAKL